ncbi:MAG: ATP-dependent protease ATPase subunit HslU, partial [Treponema sp.]|nr:ATP-dependent protease ATPase subunit HslU [Treponema sp.]
NILMIGPTGEGKTEIARRLAKLAGSPFIKVEATKYTEVGYVGRDVESMVRDLMASGFQMVKQEMQETVEAEADARTEEAILELLMPNPKKGKAKKPPSPQPIPGRTFAFGSEGKGPAGIIGTMKVFPVTDADGKEIKADDAKDQPAELPLSADTANPGDGDAETQDKSAQDGADKFGIAREKFRTMLREGKLEDKLVELMVSQSPQFPPFEMMGMNMGDMEESLSGFANFFGGGKKKKLVSVARAREIIKAEELEKLIDRDRVSDEARQRVEETGIIFIDEIDKIAVKGDRGSGPDVSREGVQRDILPIVEGATVSTKWGPVNTDHILFIAAGAFTVSKPSDLIPELQGRFPLRVELDSLGKDDFLRILTEPKNALTRQYVGLLSTENVELEFIPEAIEQLAALAAEVNSKLENIGARRLHTIMEALLEDLSFQAPDIAPAKVQVTVEYVREKLAEIVKDQDLGRYIL